MSKTCSKPSCENLGIHLCAGCSEEIYCSKNCQKEHWSQHSKFCKHAMKPEIAAKNQSFQELSSKQLQNLLKVKISNFEEKEKQKILLELENTNQKSDLLQLVKKHVKPTEIDTLLSTSISMTSGSPSSSIKTHHSKKTKAQIQKTLDSNIPVPTKEQLLQQAKMMRENPDLVRKSNRMFSNMTNKQIFDYAKQLETSARDPKQMEQIVSMSKLSSTDRERLQNLQEGLSGVKLMDDNWIKETVNTVKNKPDLIKSVFLGKGEATGVNDEQIFSFIDGASKMDAWTLEKLIQFLKFVASMSKPATQMYNKIDQVTFGSAKYVVALLVIILMYLFVKVLFQLFYVVMYLLTIFWKRFITSNLNDSGTPITISKSDQRDETEF